MATAGAAPQGSQSPAQVAALQDGPPYAPQYQALGGIPSITPDVPVNVIFLCLFLAAGASHFIIFRRNIAHHKKFAMNMMVTIFSLTRVLATCMRMAWACHPTNVHIGIAAAVFVYAGIVLLLLANLVFTERIIRAQHPNFGWTKPVLMGLPAIFAIAVATILCLVVAVLVSFYTLDPHSRHAARELQKYGSTMMAIIAFLPFVFVGISTAARKHPNQMTKTMDKFGEGSMRAKVAIVLVSSAILTLGAGFRAGATLMRPVPVITTSNPPIPVPTPWYLTKASFYIFNFTLEIIVCVLWLAVRIDKRFHTPDGAKGPFSYGGGFVFAGEAGNEKKVTSVNPDGQQDLGRRRSSLSSKVSSLVAQRSSGDLQQLESRISWGGLSSDKVQDTLGERRQILRYSAFAENEVESPAATEVGVEGAEKELGWDPESGKWAVRSTSRPMSPMSEEGSNPSRAVSPVSRPTLSFSRPLSNRSKATSPVQQ
ncbi:hypothetical protein LTR37_010873 [Vermiconidia calcicola]|uniref:Uncharacterized protein n=1 Tax=Vermiconidia calcicola TaxID=1690605 RepID=A0ACC3N3T1_9PEZI|nr:hypothetical protein LTR37_010873 [Vermiconidia calcicola]